MKKPLSFEAFCINHEDRKCTVCGNTINAGEKMELREYKLIGEDREFSCMACSLRRAVHEHADEFIRSVLKQPQQHKRIVPSELTDIVDKLRADGHDVIVQELRPDNVGDIHDILSGIFGADVDKVLSPCPDFKPNSADCRVCPARPRKPH